MAVGLQPFQSPLRTRRSPSARRRGTASIRAMAMSAVSSVRTPGVLVTVMPRCRAVFRSMWSTPVPKEAISRSCGPGLGQKPGIDPVGQGGDQNVGLLDRLHHLRLGQGMVVEIELAVEELHHPRFHGIGQASRDDDEWLIGGHEFAFSKGAVAFNYYLMICGPAIAGGAPPCPDSPRAS